MHKIPQGGIARTRDLPTPRHYLSHWSDGRIFSPEGMASLKAMYTAAAAGTYEPKTAELVLRLLRRVGDLDDRIATLELQVSLASHEIRRLSRIPGRG